VDDIQADLRSPLGGGARAKVRVPTLEGPAEIEMKVRRLAGGAAAALRGEGLRRRGGGRGDEYLRFHIVNPPH